MPTPQPFTLPNSNVKASVAYPHPYGVFMADGSEVFRDYRLQDPTKIHGAVTSLLGFSSVSSTAGKYIQRTLPHSLKDFTTTNGGNPFLYADRVEFKGQGLDATDPVDADKDNAPRFADVVLSVRYTSRPYEVVSDADMRSSGYTYDPGGGAEAVIDESTWARYVSHVVRPSFKSFTAPQGAYYYVGIENVPLQIGVNKAEHYVAWQTTWHEVPKTALRSKFINPRIEDSAGYDGILYENTVGKVNQTTFQGHDPGQLLLVGIEARPKVSAQGLRIFDVVFTWATFAPSAGVGHNHVFYPTGNVYREAIVAAGGTPASNIPPGGAGTAGKNLYDYAALEKLFRPL
jgi:hypothetical protein